MCIGAMLCIFGGVKAHTENMYTEVVVKQIRRKRLNIHATYRHTISVFSNERNVDDSCEVVKR